MSTTAKISFEEFQKLQEASEGTTRYELDQGELIVTPSSTGRHNLVYLRLWRALTAFIEEHDLGVAVTELDFRLDSDTVRRPDVAFIAREEIHRFDPDRTPIEGAPTLAVEVISAGNLAQDTRKKVRQYLTAGTSAVWVIYPALRIIEVHDNTGSRNAVHEDAIREERLFGEHKFSISLAELFDGRRSRST